MMVNCPECNADISSQADPCPQCGFPSAGFVSKQNVELRFLQIQKDPIKHLSMNIDNNITCASSVSGFFSKEHKMSVKSCSLKRNDSGYFIYIELICITCGKIKAYNS